MKKILSLFALIVCFSIAAFADVRLPDTPKPTPSPKEKKAVESYLTIKIDKEAKEARLIVPKSQIKQLRAELENLDDDSSSAAFLSFSRTQTIVSGLFMTLAFVFGGVWFARRGKNVKPNKTAVAACVLFLCGGLATIVFANAGPPPEARSITSKIFNRDVFTPYYFANGAIKVETTDKENFELIVPDKWTEEKKPE